MPFKSQKQRAKFYALAEEGKISKDTLKKWEEETGNAKLPKRASRKSSSLLIGERKPRRDAK